MFAQKFTVKLHVTKTICFTWAHMFEHRSVSVNLNYRGEKNFTSLISCLHEIMWPSPWILTSIPSHEIKTKIITPYILVAAPYVKLMVSQSALLCAIFRITMMIIRYQVHMWCTLSNLGYRMMVYLETQDNKWKTTMNISNTRILQGEWRSQSHPNLIHLIWQINSYEIMIR